MKQIKQDPFHKKQIQAGKEMRQLLIGVVILFIVLMIIALIRNKLLN